MVIAAMVAVAVIVLVVAVAVGRRTRSRHVTERFGPEYERAVAAAGSDAGAAEKELLARKLRSSMIPRVHSVRPTGWSVR